MLDVARIFYFVFGAVTIAGGIMGFVKAKSRASLIAGGISGLALIAAGYMIGSIGMPGIVLGLIVSLALAGRFAPKIKDSVSKTVPGMMTALGILGILAGVAALLRP